MATLDTADRDRLRDRSFAWIDKQGERHLPINDEAHVRNAIARFDQTDFDEPGAKAEAARRILAAAKKHGIEVDPGDDATVVMVHSGQAELGFVALSQLRVPGRPARGSTWIVPAGLHAPIRQDAVLLAAGRDQPAAQALLAWLKSASARAEMRAWGYDEPVP